MNSADCGGTGVRLKEENHKVTGAGAAQFSIETHAPRGGAGADDSTIDAQFRTGTGAATVSDDEDHQRRLGRGGAGSHFTPDAWTSKSIGAAAEVLGNLDDQKTRDLCGGVDRQAEIMPLLATISVMVAARRSILRSEVSAGLSARAFCRLAKGGDKTEGANLLARVKAGDESVPSLVADVVRDHLGAETHYRLARKARERQITKLVEQLPVWQSWASGVRGFGALGFGAIVAETYAASLGHFTVSQHWQRLGIGAIDFQTASRRRKTTMFLVGSAMVKQGAEYRDFYLEAKERIAEAHPDLTKGHVHNRAQRLMVKRLVADMWEKWTEWRFGAEEKEIAA